MPPPFLRPSSFAPQFHSATVSQLHSLTTSQSHNFTTSQIHNRIKYGPRRPVSHLDSARFFHNSSNRPRPRRSGDHHHAHQHQQRPQQRARRQRLAAKVVAHHHRNHRIDICVSPHARRRLMMNQPHIGGITNQRSGHDEIPQRPPGARRDGRGSKAAELAERGRSGGKQYPSRQHLRARAHRLRLRERKNARKRRRNRPSDRRNNQRKSARRVDSRAAHVQRPAHQHCHAAQPDQQRHGQPRRHPLRAQHRDLSQRHERRNGRQHHRRHTGRHALFSPEQGAVVTHKNQQPQQRSRHPLPRIRQPLPAQGRPRKQKQSRGGESHRRQQKRRNFAHSDANRKKRRSPYEVNDSECQQLLPRRRLPVGLHNLIYSSVAIRLRVQ